MRRTLNANAIRNREESKARGRARRAARVSKAVARVKRAWAVLNAAKVELGAAVDAMPGDERRAWEQAAGFDACDLEDTHRLAGDLGA